MCPRFMIVAVWAAYKGNGFGMRVKVEVMFYLEF